MTNSERALETKDRIEREIDFYNGSLPKDVNLVWQGYISALSEWGLIESEDRSTLRKLLPNIKYNPAYSIATGIPGDYLKLE